MVYQLMPSPHSKDFSVKIVLREYFFSFLILACCVIFIRVRIYTPNIFAGKKNKSEYI